MLHANFQWTKSINVDNKFSYSRTINTTKENELLFDEKISTTIEKNTNYDVVYHNEFKSFVLGTSNYLFVKGKFKRESVWDEENDEDMLFFKNNFENSPLYVKHTLSNINFDFENRKFTYNIDLNKTNKNKLTVLPNPGWALDLKTSFKPITKNSEMVCLLAKNIFDWNTIQSIISPGQSVQYNKLKSESYLFVSNGPVMINDSVLVKTDEVKKITSDNIKITAPKDKSTYSSIIIKESVK